MRPCGTWRCSGGPAQRTKQQWMEGEAREFHHFRWPKTAANATRHDTYVGRLLEALLRLAQVRVDAEEDWEWASSVQPMRAGTHADTHSGTLGLRSERGSTGRVARHVEITAEGLTTKQSSPRKSGTTTKRARQPHQHPSGELHYRETAPHRTAHPAFTHTPRQQQGQSKSCCDLKTGNLHHDPPKPNTRRSLVSGLVSSLAAVDKSFEAIFPAQTRGKRSE